MHRDSLGTVQPIVPGDVNWMTAGRGIVHSERSAGRARERRTRLHGICRPGSRCRKRTKRSSRRSAITPAARCRVIAHARRHRCVSSPATAFGAASRRADVLDDVYLAAEHRRPARRSTLPAGTRGARRLSGRRRSGDRRRSRSPSDTWPCSRLDVTALVRAQTASRVMLLGGAKMDGARFIWWNFVASSQEKIEAAKRAGASRRSAVPGETEFIPLPERAGNSRRLHPPAAPARDPWHRARIPRPCRSLPR